MTLRQAILTDSTTVFTRTDDFAEAVTYHPRTGASRTVNAVVLREQITVLQEDGDVLLPVWQVHVANDATDGISSSEINLGGDQIALPPRDGKTAERKSIVRLLIQDIGMLVVECR